MRHLLLVEVNADDEISSETVATLFSEAMERGIVEKVFDTVDEDDERQRESFPKPRHPDIRDLNVGPVKVL